MKMLVTNQTSSKSGLDLNGSPLFAYPDDSVTAIIESDNGDSSLSSGYGGFSGCSGGSSDGDGLFVVVLDVFCFYGDVGVMWLFFSV